MYLDSIIYKYFHHFVFIYVEDAVRTIGRQKSSSGKVFLCEDCVRSRFCEIWESICGIYVMALIAIESAVQIRALMVRHKSFWRAKCAGIYMSVKCVLVCVCVSVWLWRMCKVGG